MTDLADALSLERIAELATPYAIAVNVPYVVALTAVTAEVAWIARARGPARSRVLRSAATAAPMAAGALVVGVVYTVIFRALWEQVGAWRFEPAAELWHDHRTAGALVAFVAWDLSGWLYHLIGHRTRVGWAAHQPHHSGPDFDATLGLRQSWTPFHGLLHHPLLALAGFDLHTVIICSAISNCWQVLQHTSLPVKLPRAVEAIVMTPRAHRHHHGRKGDLVNLGPVLTIWDRVAGTWVSPDVPAPTTYGPPRPAGRNPIAIELAGWGQLLGRRPALAGGSPGR